MTPDQLSEKSVVDIIKCRAHRIGLDAKSVGGHSLRAGFLTSAACRGASIFKMIDVLRHRNVDTLGALRSRRREISGSCRRRVALTCVRLVETVGQFQLMAASLRITVGLSVR